MQIIIIVLKTWLHILCFGLQIFFKIFKNILYWPHFLIWTLVWGHIFKQLFHFLDYVLPFNAKFFFGCLQLIQQHQKTDFINIKNNTVNGPSQIPQEQVNKRDYIYSAVCSFNFLNLWHCNFDSLDKNSNQLSTPHHSYIHNAYVHSFIRIHSCSLCCLAQV
jgi:hypothetical protein